MSDNKKRIWPGIVAVLLLIAAAYFAGKLINQPVEIDGGYREIMGTFARIIVVADGSRQANACILAGFDEMRRIDSVMSDYRPDSELSKVNREAFAGPVKVSTELFGILQKSVEFSRLTNGAFDITVGPLVDLWRKAGETNSAPDADTLAATKARVGYEKLILDANAMTVKFAVDGMRLDLGGIGKGYAVDKAVDVIQKHGAIAGMVDSGGNIRCFGRPINRTNWLVGIQDPNIADSVEQIADSPDASGLMILKLNPDKIGSAVATSGDYRRFVTVAGKKVSHIIDKSTAAGANKMAGDTIIAKTAIEADALSTAVNVLGPDKGLAFIESLPDVECILITPAPEFQVLKSSGADAYLQ
jgi:thiamine biosynthesis lipoprotein